MRRFAIILGIAFGLCGSTSAFGQDPPQYEIFGGYSYLSADTNKVATPSRQNVNGWEASVSWNYNKWFAAEGDFSGYYKTYPVDTDAFGFDYGIVNLKISDYSYLGGPRFNFRPLFFHALVGGDHLTGSVNVPLVGSVSASQDSFAAAFGGGVEWKVAPHWAVRGSADYVLTRHNVFKVVDPLLSNYTQNNFRASVGIVYTFGSTRHASSGAGNQTTSAPEQAAPTSEAALLGVSGYASEVGFKITSVRAGSPAAQAAFNPGDIISGIDGREVHSSVEIETVIAASTSGTITIRCLIQTPAVGMVATEREVKVR